ncbi:MAG: carotenoid biosynthesis protein, partial [Solirubrobacteraceae bacterium]
MRPSRVLLAALGAAQVAYGQVPGARGVRSTRALVGLMTVASAAEAAEARGWRRGLAPIGAAGAIGFGAELLGVHTGRPFGAYAYTGKLGPRVGGVPLLAAAAWALMARPAWIAAGWVAPRRAGRVVLAAAALTALDVFLDPRMAREGDWIWPDGGA